LPKLEEGLVIRLGQPAVYNVLGVVALFCESVDQGRRRRGIDQKAHYAIRRTAWFAWAAANSSATTIALAHRHRREHVVRQAGAPTARLLRGGVEVRGAGRIVHLSTSVSAAKAAGVDLGGVVFCVGGEPLTRRRAAVFAEAGVRCGSLYSMAECGQIGSGCGDSAEPDVVRATLDDLGSRSPAERMMADY
jgi:hypothetical protein